MLDNLKDISIADYDYPLSDKKIAKHPLANRDDSKLLVLKDSSIAETTFSSISNFLPPHSTLVFNETKVIHARLLFTKDTGATVEIFCLEPWNQDLTSSFESVGHATWLCLIGNNKRWRSGTLTKNLIVSDIPVALSAEKISSVGDCWVVRFTWNSDVSFSEVIENAGVIPLPPYLHRTADDDDNTRYQTVFARNEGSVAAPTAGLHFTKPMLDSFVKQGFDIEYVTLHVGAGTFKPVSSDTIGEHEMHVEKINVSSATLRNILNHNPYPIIAVGTTSVRTLESVYWFGVQLSVNPLLDFMHIEQWEPYSNPTTLSVEDSFSLVLNWLDTRGLSSLSGETQLLILPGYKFHVISGLVTNFHQPKSTLLLLVSALIGNDWRRCYQYALDHDFRFLSYGDGCLFL